MALVFNLTSSNRTNASIEPGLTLLNEWGFRNRVPYSEMEQISKYILRSWMRHIGHLVAETCWRLWRICCYSAILGFVNITRYQKFTEAVGCWFWYLKSTYAHRAIWGMSDYLLASLLLDFTGPKFIKEDMRIKKYYFGPCDSSK